MRRPAILLALLFAMLWQSVAVAHAGWMTAVGADLAHAVLHWNDEGHHHHDDGSYQLDDSRESAQHMLGDHVNATAVPMAAPVSLFPVLASAAPGGLRDARLPAPMPDGLLRPPRARA